MHTDGDRTGARHEQSRCARPALPFVRTRPSACGPGPYAVSDLQALWRVAGARFGVQDVRLHDLRRRIAPLRRFRALRIVDAGCRSPMRCRKSISLGTMNQHDKPRRCQSRGWRFESVSGCQTAAKTPRTSAASSHFGTRSSDRCETSPGQPPRDARWRAVDDPSRYVTTPSAVEALRAAVASRR